MPQPDITIDGVALYAEVTIPFRAGWFPRCTGASLSTAPTANDFQCFQNAYAAQQAYADCNGDGQLNVNDFICFQNAAAAAIVQEPVQVLEGTGYFAGPIGGQGWRVMIAPDGQGRVKFTPLYPGCVAYDTREAAGQLVTHTASFGAVLGAADAPVRTGAAKPVGPTGLGVAIGGTVLIAAVAAARAKLKK